MKLKFRAKFKKYILLIIVQAMGGSKSKPVGNIVCIGLDHAGKSTIINYLKADKDKVRPYSRNPG